MQQNQVIAELSEYVEGNPPDKENVSKTVEYLDGCRDLFERGILSHEKIADEHSPVLQNMFNGFPSLLAGLIMLGNKVGIFRK